MPANAVRTSKHNVGVRNALEGVAQGREVHHLEGHFAEREDDTAPRGVLLLHERQPLLQLLRRAQQARLLLVVRGIHAAAERARRGRREQTTDAAEAAAARPAPPMATDLKLADKCTEDPENDFELQEKLGEG